MIGELIHVMMMPIIVLIIMFAVIIRKRKFIGLKPENRYDERQLQVQGKAHRIAFWMMLFGLFFCISEAQVSVDGQSHLLLPFLYATMLIPVLFYSIYCIINDAYFDLKQYPSGTYKWWQKLLMAVVGLANGIVAIKIISDNGLMSDGAVNNAALSSITLSILFIGIVAAAIIHDARAIRRQNSDEES